jgi:hypothetical protein
MSPETIQEQYRLASHWFQAILSRLDQAIIPLSALTSSEVIESWEKRQAEILAAYQKYLSEGPKASELLDALQFISKVAMGNHRAALRLKGMDPAEILKMIPTPAFPKLPRVVFQGFMPE